MHDTQHVHHIVTDAVRHPSLARQLLKLSTPEEVPVAFSHRRHKLCLLLLYLLNFRDAGLGCGAALALKTLAENHPANQTLIGQTAGAVTGLVALLFDGDSTLRAMVLVALRMLARNHPVNRAKIRHAMMSSDGQWQQEL